MPDWLKSRISNPPSRPEPLADAQKREAEAIAAELEKLRQRASEAGLDAAVPLIEMARDGTRLLR